MITVSSGVLLWDLFYFFFIYERFPIAVPVGCSVCLYANDANITNSSKSPEDVELISFINIHMAKIHY